MVGGAIIRDRQIFKTISDNAADCSEHLGKAYGKINEVENELVAKLDNSKDKISSQINELNEKVNTTLVQKSDFIDANNQMRESISTLTKSHNDTRENTQIMLVNILNEIKK